MRVNEVKSRGARPNFNRENFRRGMGRGMGWQRDRVRERDQYHGRAKHWDQDRDTDRVFNRSRDYRHGTDQEHFSQEQTQDHFSDQDHNDFRSMDEYEKNYRPSHEESSDHILNENQDAELDGTRTHCSEDDKHNDQPLRKRNR